MDMIRMVIGVLLLIMLNVACAGREPVLIDIKQTSDSSLGCDELRRHIDDCTKAIIEKHHAGKKKIEETIGAAIVGYVIFPPLFFAMDLKKADYKEMGAFQERRNYLIGLAKEKTCTWCGQMESDDALMIRAAAEYDALKKHLQQETASQQDMER